jgi:hypothetical protein
LEACHRGLPNDRLRIVVCPTATQARTGLVGQPKSKRTAAWLGAQVD